MSDNRPTRRPLYVYNGGFLTQRQMRRIVALAGYDLRTGLPPRGALVGVWGKSPTAHRGEAIAARRGCKLVRIEDAFLRSVTLGRDGDAPLGLQIDESGVHFDPSVPSGLETLLATHPLDDAALLARARAGTARLKQAHLSKYNTHDPALPAPDAGYVLVVDQTRNDASVRASGADKATFRAMLDAALREHPAARIVIKTHPETVAGHRDGYFSEADTDARVSLCDAPLSPWHLLAGAVAVYTVCSQFGFEAILAGHKPVVFGQPFYCGWGLSDDRKPLPRRTRTLTPEQLFAAAMILYPVWYDPFRDRLCSFEQATDTLAARTAAWRDDCKGWVAADMRLWKRAPLQKVFGTPARVRFAKGDDAAAQAQASGRRLMAWASGGRRDAVLVEDGFLRSRGLGADLIAPLSLVLDDLGIYYDATRPSRLEALIAASTALDDSQRARTQALIDSILAQRLSKYNLQRKAGLPTLPDGPRILVPGQVEDDASIRLGAPDINTNRGLLLAARAANPDAVVIYKPHPDVEAGLRQGHVPDAAQIADAVLGEADPIAALDAVDAVWTMTSLLGFEALLRGKSVTCLGNPFYAGWGLTDDRAPAVPRRTAKPDLLGLAHATLIAYPRYFDPVTGTACPPEVVVERLARGDIPAAGPFNRALAKLQGVFASYAYLWR